MVFEHGVLRATAIAVMCGAVSIVGHAESQTTPSEPGAKVGIMIITIKVDKRQQFEGSVRKFLGALNRTTSAPVTKRNQIRLLVPTEANEDGTYTYVYLLPDGDEGDPAKDREQLRRAGISDAEAERLEQQLEECYTGLQRIIALQDKQCSVF
jgi:hypothetical protein